MELINMFRRKKHRKLRQVKNFMTDIELTKQELSHYPHHVLCRALLGACSIINAMDPKRQFVFDGAQDVSTLKAKEIACLALSITDNVMEVYIDNKKEIDEALNRELH
tara:strand:+ start:66 stop:389 length:324 start_codon:yes stop_codon:yes gene_type:complete